jgi:hypothetical protein
LYAVITASHSAMVSSVTFTVIGKLPNVLSCSFLSAFLHHYNAVQHIYSHKCSAHLTILCRGLVARLYSLISQSKVHLLCVAVDYAFKHSLNTLIIVTNDFPAFFLNVLCK